ncbi:polyprenyl synthetase [Streptomyces sp. NPDC006645]|uniref:polyprenyl synthetase n=1 Tax=unclassified Streptomyces TaxID=2593676 RepID=UPI0033BF4846
MDLPSDVGRDGDGGGRPVLLLAGLADLALSTCGSALKAAHGLLDRSDLGDLVAQGRQDLQARGRLALDRLGTDLSGAGFLGTAGGGEAHMEVLARHAQRRAAATSSATSAAAPDGSDE